MKIRVSILYYSSLTSLNGVSSFIKSIALGFCARTDIELSIYSKDVSFNIKGPFNWPKQQTKNKKNLNPYLHRILKSLSQKSSLFSFLYVYLTYNRNARNIVKSKGEKCNDSDIIFFQDFFTAHYYEKAHPQTKSTDKKRIMVLHTDGNPLGMLYGYFPRLKENKISAQYYNSIVLSALNTLDAIVLLSQLAKEKFLSQYPQFEHKSFVVLNGIEDLEGIYDEKRAQHNKGFHNFICVGTISERKGHDLLIDALINLKSEFSERIRLYLIGDGPLLASLEKKCKKYSLTNVYLEGARSNVVEYLKRGDVFILPSRDEGMPIAILEAIRAGLPVISTKVGGIPDLVIDGYNGYLINPDIKELTAVFAEIVSGKYNLVAFSKNSRRHFEHNFKSEIMINRYYDLFHKVFA